jgi:conjugal transfer pilin signal peptidase TrbI
MMHSLKALTTSIAGSVAARFDASRFHARLRRHLRRWLVAYLLVPPALLCFDAHYQLGLNATRSLPEQLFLIERGQFPNRGEYVAFRWHGGGPYPAGTVFIKTLAGVPGDVVSRQGREYFVNGRPVGTAKPVSREGEMLAPGPTGVLPERRYYVAAPHPDSLDSRYALTGWIDATQIIGRAHAVF